MDFTPRMQQILQRLLSETDFVSEQTLADDLGISKRTVQRELDRTTGALASYGLQLQRKKKAGLMLIGPEKEKERLAASLQTASAMDFTDKQNRRRYLLFEILRDRTPKKLFYYSQLLGVSEATASSLRAVKKTTAKPCAASSAKRRLPKISKTSMMARKP